MIEENRQGIPPDPAEAQTVYTALLAHAAGIPLAAGQGVDIANFALMLWRIRTKQEQ